MNKTLPTLRYLSKGFVWMTGVGYFSMVAATVASYMIYQLTSRYNPVQEPVTLTLPPEVTAGVFAVLIGLLLFQVTLKVVVANGVSRKTFLKANLLAAFMSAAALALFNLVIYLVHQMFWPAVFISQLAFPQISLPGIVVLHIVLYFLLIVAGWLITLAYARGTTLTRWVISLAPFALFAIWRVADANAGGAISEAIVAYKHLTMGTPSSAILTLTAYSALLFGAVYLLLRRAPVCE